MFQISQIRLEQNTVTNTNCPRECKVHITVHDCSMW